MRVSSRETQNLLFQKPAVWRLRNSKGITREAVFPRLTASPYFFPERVVNQLACLFSPSTAAHHV